MSFADSAHRTPRVVSQGVRSPNRFAPNEFARFAVGTRAERCAGHPRFRRRSGAEKMKRPRAR